MRKPHLLLRIFSSIPPMAFDPDPTSPSWFPMPWDPLGMSSRAFNPSSWNPHPFPSLIGPMARLPNGLGMGRISIKFDPRLRWSYPDHWRGTSPEKYGEGKEKHCISNHPFSIHRYPLLLLLLIYLQTWMQEKIL